MREYKYMHPSRKASVQTLTVSRQQQRDVDNMDIWVATSLTGSTGSDKYTDLDSRTTSSRIWLNREHYMRSATFCIAMRLA